MIIKKILNTIFPFSDFLYIFQLEEYSTVRLIRWLPKFFFRRNIQIRQKLVITKRVKITLLLSISLYLLDIVFTILLFHFSLMAFILITLETLLIPIYTLIANFFTDIYFERLKKKQRNKAKEKIQNSKNLTVITIAGSYGKTTTKNFIFQLLNFSHKTQMIPGNINTPAGIANWVLNYLEKDTQILISEVDAYVIGEILKSCEILRPKYSIITNIGDQHLERFGTESKLAKALCEVFEGSDDNAYLLTNSETKQKINKYVDNENKFNINLIEDIELHFDIEISQQLKQARSNLSDSNKSNLDFAMAIVKQVGYEKRFLIDALKKLELPDRRQKAGDIFGFEGIDDSYNISYTTALSGLQSASNIKKLKNKKLLVITAGIPELSIANKDKNKLLGIEIEKVADFCLILGSDFAPEVASGLKNQQKFKVVKSLQKVINEELSNFDKNEWVILLQPELSDLYY